MVLLRFLLKHKKSGSLSQQQLYSASQKYQGKRSAPAIIVKFPWRDISSELTKKTFL